MSTHLDDQLDLHITVGPLYHSFHSRFIPSSAKCLRQVHGGTKLNPFQWPFGHGASPLSQAGQKAFRFFRINQMPLRGPHYRGAEEQEDDQERIDFDIEIK